MDRINCPVRFAPVVAVLIAHHLGGGLCGQEIPREIHIDNGTPDIRREVEQELHNDAVMQELKQSGEQLKSEAAAVSNDLQSAVDKADQALTSGPEEPPSNKPQQPST